MSHVHLVIHHRRAQLTLEQAELALEEGADGIFLISHDGADAELPALAADLSKRWATGRTASAMRPLVGLSLLTFGPLAAFRALVESAAQALWVGASGISSSSTTPEAQKLATAAGEHPETTIFAGVAFKYQAADPDPAAAAQAARALGFLPTTSGSGTGSAPALEKIERMSRAVQGKLAVASGMTPANVALFAPLVEHILVSTGIALDEHRLDPARLREFVSEVRRVRPA
jgi:hypothetical protein